MSSSIHSWVDGMKFIARTIIPNILLFFKIKTKLGVTCSQTAVKSSQYSTHLSVDFRCVLVRLVLDTKLVVFVVDAIVMLHMMWVVVVCLAGSDVRVHTDSEK